jgi:hypothetical protein
VQTNTHAKPLKRYSNNWLKDCLGQRVAQISDKIVNNKNRKKTRIKKID